MLSRRFFLTAGASSLVSLGLPQRVSAKTSSNSSDWATIEELNPSLKETCDVFSDGQLVAHLDLVGLTSAFKSDPVLGQYTLNFKSAESVNLAEANYLVVHPVLGPLDLFLQPCGTLNRDRHDGRQYRACMAVFR